MQAAESKERVILDCNDFYSRAVLCFGTRNQMICTKLSQYPEAYLEIIRTSMKEHFCENS